MIVTLIPDTVKYDFDLILKDEEKIKWTENSLGNIIIFLKDGHFTCAIYNREEKVIEYFDPYGNTDKKRRERDLK